MPKTHRINFEELKAKADFTAVLLHYRITAFGAGEQLKILCPFHDDERPSCSVNLAKGLWHCFRGCGAGNVLDFVHRMETRDGSTVSLVQAAERLAEMSGLELGSGKATPNQSEARRAAKGTATGVRVASAEKGAQKRPERPQTASHKPTFNKPLGFQLTLEPDHPYLSQRGIAPELVELFGLGFCAQGSMAGRVCIPIRHAGGVIVAYAGRWAGPVEELPESEEKYKLPKGFHKSLELFNLHRVKRTRHLVLVEGYFSVIRLHGLSVPSVALMGSSMSEEQIALLLTHCPALKAVTVLMDGDEAGRNAADAIAPRLSRHWWTRIVELPEGEQPDTMKRDALLRLIKPEQARS